jgi:antitoxin component of MazEF toxin-antitoxin module
MKIRKVIKTGNSLCLTIPSNYISDFDIKEGDIAQLKVNKTKASITYIFSGHPRQLSLIDKSKSK